MRKGPWLLLDVSYLAYRSFYAMGNLSHREIATGVVYGVLREVVQLQEHFATDRVAFCFDYGKPLRSGELKSYKQNRREGKSEEEIAKVLAVKDQIKHLRKDYLLEAGFRNLHYQKGFEADDVIAGIVKDRPNKRFVIVSSDQDLFQLLSPMVTIWNPHKKELYTQEDFSAQFGLSPTQWADVKALAGCSSDNIPGIKGIGEKTAAKFINGTLTTGAKFKSIVEGSSVWKRNLPLVTLPYPGIDSFRLVYDETSAKSWKRLIDRLGMHSLENIPGVPTVKSKGLNRASLGVFGAKKKKRK